MEKAMLNDDRALALRYQQGPFHPLALLLAVAFCETLLHCRATSKRELLVVFPPQTITIDVAVLICLAMYGQLHRWCEADMTSQE